MTAKNPPMGWNSWDCYGASVNEATVRANAEYMAKNLKKYGWEYIVVDIQWYEPTAESQEYHPFTDLEMDEYGRLMPAVNRFPSAADGAGFKPLADYVHSLGLKFGIHIMRGIPRQAVHKNCPVKGTNYTARQVAKTASICEWNTDMYGLNPKKPGAREYYDSIFELYASWGVDFIKCDDIARELPHEEKELFMLSDALKNCGREMVLSLSPGPSLPEKAEVYKKTANMWRITDDFWDKWELLYNMFERAEMWCCNTGAGHWADCDMLPIGAIRQNYGRENRTKFTHDEQYTMMTLWCILRSPMMMGGDMVYNDGFTLSLLTNERVLEMLTKSRSAHQVYRRDVDGNEVILWKAHRLGGGYYLAIFNCGEDSVRTNIDLEECELEDVNVTATDLWTGDEAKLSGKIDVEIPSHGTRAYRIEL